MLIGNAQSKEFVEKKWRDVKVGNIVKGIKVRFIYSNELNAGLIFPSRHGSSKFISPQRYLLC